MDLPLLPRESSIAVPDPNHEPIGGVIFGIILSLCAITVLTSFLTQRILAIRLWSRVPLVVWLVLAIFVDSWIFVFATVVVHHGLGFNADLAVCSSAILLCLVCYVTTKILIYMFLVEKAFIIRGGLTPRLQSKLYLFNSFGMLSIYVVVSILNFVFRITRLEEGQCIIGMKKVAMIPLISYDLLVNVYLTILFLIPLQNLYSFRRQQHSPANPRLRTVALRTFIGALCTTTSSVTNLTVLMVLNGEPGWVCLVCCNLDILFSAIVIQWVTSRDNAGTRGGTATSRSCYRNSHDTIGTGTTRFTDTLLLDQYLQVLGSGVGVGAHRILSSCPAHHHLDPGRRCGARSTAAVNVVSLADAAAAGAGAGGGGGKSELDITAVPCRAYSNASDEEALRGNGPLTDEEEEEEGGHHGSAANSGQRGPGRER
ncbi:hypothetical protein F5Y15DRAFT_64912 [Xylariaceae sp. FL0016]|nr:hypothetical protein F5Y15DRAFT_64912 [Xylariaceae sp. FL0016]